MGLNTKKPIFGRKPIAGNVYKWQPSDNTFIKPAGVNLTSQTGCNATPYSHGDDFITTYVYDIYSLNGIMHHEAYVECGYVE